MKEEENATPEPQYRKRIKGFARHVSWDNGEDEFVKVPDECPNVCTIGINMLDIKGYEYE